MKALKASQSSAQDESLDAAYITEVARKRAIKRRNDLWRMKEDARRADEPRGTHLEKGRSMVAPSPLGDAAWFI